MTIDEAKLRRQASRGERAKRLLEDPFIAEAFAKLEATVLDRWKATRGDEERERENAYLMWRLLQNLRHQFTHAVSTGEVAHKELMRLREPSKLRKVIHG